MLSFNFYINLFIYNFRHLIIFTWLLSFQDELDSTQVPCRRPILASAWMSALNNYYWFIATLSLEFGYLRLVFKLGLFFRHNTRIFKHFIVRTSSLKWNFDFSIHIGIRGRDLLTLSNFWIFLLHKFAFIGRLSLKCCIFGFILKGWLPFYFDLSK